MLGKVLLVHRWVGCFFFCCIWSVLYHFPFTVKTENKICINMHIKKKKRKHFCCNRWDTGRPVLLRQRGT